MGRYPTAVPTVVSAKQAAAEPSLLLTIPATAKLLSVGINKVYALLWSGDLKAVRIGGSRRIVRSSVDELIKQLQAAEESPRAS